MRLIDADALFLPDENSDKVFILGGRCGGGKTVALAIELLKKKVKDAPTINPDDLRPQRRWIETNWAEHDGHGEVVTYYDVKALKCNNCCHCFKEELLWRKNYCPNCGAKMTKGE